MNNFSSETLAALIVAIDTLALAWLIFDAWKTASEAARIMGRPVVETLESKLARIPRGGQESELERDLRARAWRFQE